MKFFESPILMVSAVSLFILSSSAQATRQEATEYISKNFQNLQKGSKQYKSYEDAVTYLIDADIKNPTLNEINAFISLAQAEINVREKFLKALSKGYGHILKRQIPPYIATIVKNEHGFYVCKLEYIFNKNQKTYTHYIGNNTILKIPISEFESKNLKLHDGDFFIFDTYESDSVLSFRDPNSPKTHLILKLHNAL